MGPARASPTVRPSLHQVANVSVTYSGTAAQSSGPRIDQVGPLKNVKVVPIPKAQGPAEWWSGGVNIMRRKGKALNDGVPDIAAVT